MKKIQLVIMASALCSAVMFAGEGPEDKTLLEERAEAAKKEQKQLQEERKRLDEELKLHEQQQKEAQAVEQHVNLSEFEKQKSDVLKLVNQFGDAYKHYTAGRIKEGDAALLKIDGKDLLSQFSIEQLAKIISALKPEPEMRFMMLSQLADVNAHRGTLVSERPTSIRLITGLLGSLQSDDFQKLFADKKVVQGFARIIDQLKSLVKKPVHFLPELPTEELFYEMMSTAQRLVAVVTTAPAQQKKDVVASLLAVIKSIPQGSLSRLWSDILKDLPIRFLPRDYESVREWLELVRELDVSNPLDASALIDLKESVLQGARKKGTLGALREAMRLVGPKEPESVLFKSLVAVEDDYLKLIATQSGLRQLVDEDPALVVEALIGLTAKEPSLASGYVIYLLRNIPTLIKTLDAESKGRDLDAARKKTLQARVKAITELYEQLPALLIPDYNVPRELLSEVFNYVKAHESFEPVFWTWEPKRLKAYLFGIPKERSSDVVVSLKRFMKVYKFYADFPRIQKELLNEANQHYDKLLSNEEWNQLLEEVSSNEELLRFLYGGTARLDVFNDNFLNDFKNDLLKRALYKAATKNHKALLIMIPALFDIQNIVNVLLKYKEGNIILYDLLSDIPDNQFAAFISDIRQEFEAHDLPIILKAVPYLQSERAKRLIDAIAERKENFDLAESVKPLEEWLVFAVTKSMLNEATAAYKKNLKQEQERLKKQQAA